jgi:uncharacterized protein YcfL
LKLLIKLRCNRIGLLLIVATVFLVGCASKPSVDSSEQSQVVLEKRPAIEISDLPTKFLDPVDTSSQSAIERNLKSRDSLTLDGTTLTVGPIKGNRTVTLACNRLKLLNGARIITNGNLLTIVAMNMEFNNSGGIDSFPAENAKAGIGVQGADGGRVEIYATKGVTGSLRISLPGQGGGDGNAGGGGPGGLPGGRGANGVDAMVGCAHGGTDGAPGGTGGPGLPGGDGATGGNGGDLVLHGEAAKDNESHFSYQAPGGTGGTGGAGGPGGPGGPGGEGGSGSTSCSGGHGGAQGGPGPKGAQGSNGSNGKSSGKLQVK